MSRVSASLLLLLLCACQPELPGRACASNAECFQGERCLAGSCVTTPPVAERDDAGASDASEDDAADGLADASPEPDEGLAEDSAVVEEDAAIVADAAAADMATIDATASDAAVVDAALTDAATGDVVISDAGDPGADAAGDSAPP